MSPMPMWFTFYAAALIAVGNVILIIVAWRHAPSRWFAVAFAGLLPISIGVLVHLIRHACSIIRSEHRRGHEIVIRREPAGVAPSVVTWYGYCLQCGPLNDEPVDRVRAWELRDEHASISGHNVTGVRPWKG